MKVIFLMVTVACAVVFGILFYSSVKEPAAPTAVSAIKKPFNQVAMGKNDSNTHGSGSFDNLTEQAQLPNLTKKEHGSSSDQQESYSEKSIEELEERYDAISDNDQYPTLLSRLSAMEARRPDVNYSPQAVLSAIEKPAAWETTDEPGDKLNKLSQEELDDGRQFVHFDPLKVETLMQGDHMEVPVDAIGRVFDMRIDSVRVFGDGNIMWKGPITNVDGGGSVTITQSQKISVAAVVLAEDDYTLQSHGADGWIVDSGTLFKINPGEVDYIEVENESR